MYVCMYVFTVDQRIFNFTVHLLLLATTANVIPNHDVMSCYYIPRCQIRFKVRAVNFSAVSALVSSSSAPAGGKSSSSSSRGSGPGSGSEAASLLPLSSAAAVPVMQVVGCTNDFGLGLVSWW